MFTTVIGVPYNSAGRTTGVARAPGVLAEAGLVPPGELGLVDLPPGSPVRGPSGLLAEPLLTEMLARASAVIGDALRAGDRPLVVGGDCPVLLAALVACRSAFGRVGLLFVDGHEDAWDPRASPTGEAADSELGLALGRHRDALPEPLASQLPLLDPADVAMLGARDAGELAAYGQPSLAGEVLLLRPDDLREEGIAAATRRAVEAIGAQRSWWLHVDLDVLATDQLAAVDYPQDGGLTWVALTDLVGTALSRRDCLGWTLCIYNPDLDPDRTQARKIVDFVDDIGKLRLESARIGVEGAGHGKAGTSLGIMKVSMLPDPWRSCACPPILADHPAVGPVLCAAARAQPLPSRPSVGLPPATGRRPGDLRQAGPSPGVGCGYRKVADQICSATTIRDRRDQWIAAGIFAALELLVLQAYDRMVGLELGDLAVDGCITKAPCGGDHAGRSPVDRGKQGRKRSTVTEARGIPLGTVAAAANRNDSPLLGSTMDTLDRLGPLPVQPTVHLDRGYDSSKTREALAERGMTGQIAEKGRPAPIPAGQRWPVERTHAWGNQFKKLVWNTERRAPVIDAFLAFAHAIITLRRLLRQAWTLYRWDTRPPRCP